MKKKDILILASSLVGIIICGLFIYNTLFPKTETNQNQDQKQDSQDNFEYTKKNIDEKTLEQLESLNDYGKATQEGIGKTNLFEF